MEIPQNTQTDNRKEKLIENVIKTFEKDVLFSLGHASSGIPLSIAKEVAKEFVNKGYHAKITYFRDGRASYQFLYIAKYVLDETSALMVYSEIIGQKC